MTDREKLIEILRTKPFNMSEVSGGRLADHLIAHGVTVQEWISVTERLPEPGDYVFVCDTREDWYGLWEFSGAAWYDAGYQPWSIDEVTHWQYLPQPPKGE